MSQPGAAPVDHILIVDDDAGTRHTIASILGADGFTTEEADTGQEALDRIATSRCSAVLLDNQMPGLSGIDVLVRLRADPVTRTLPVLLVTADEDVSDRVRGLEEGANDYIVKPFHPEELVARVRAQLREQSAWAEVLEQRLAERAAIAAALCRMHPETSAQGTAEVVCSEVRTLRDLDGVALIVFLPDGLAVPLAVDGARPWGLEAGVALPPPFARALAARAAAGPWCEHEAGGLWCAAPFTSDLGPRGLLVLTAAPTTAANDAQQLAGAIDFAAVIGGLIVPSLLGQEAHADRQDRLSDILRRQAFAPVFQPIVRLGDAEIIGFEALTRFTDGTRPDVRFAEAAALDRGLQLEAATLAVALRAAHALPPGCWLSVNVSPELILDEGTLDRVLGSCPLPVVLELTEHNPVADYGRLREALNRLRPRLQFSVDDAGSGFASLRHVLTLEPDFMKLDKSWVSGVEDDVARQALVAGLCHFAGRTGCHLIAEGIETGAERATLEQLHIELGQGYLFGRPVPAPQ